LSPLHLTHRLEILTGGALNTVRRSENTTMSPVYYFAKHPYAHKPSTEYVI
jgi:hypothetical protein